MAKLMMQMGHLKFQAFSGSLNCEFGMGRWEFFCTTEAAKKKIAYHHHLYYQRETPMRYR
ncbi:MAG: hypothetical protein PHI06_10065 [Desulfobulbaceae bacterium]|nr:hypothetical protein [Desulfobulbaceae bacterium]